MFGQFQIPCYEFLPLCWLHWIPEGCKIAQLHAPWPHIWWEGLVKSENAESWTVIIPNKLRLDIWYIYTYILYYCIIYITPETNHQPRVVLQSLLTTCLLYPKICWIDPLEISIWTQFPWISHMKHRWYRFMDVPFHIFPGFPWSTHVNLHRLLKSAGVTDLASIDVTPILWTFWTLNLEAWINEGWFHGDFMEIS